VQKKIQITHTANFAAKLGFDKKEIQTKSVLNTKRLK